MAVKEQMARAYPPSAEELAQFLPDTDCGDCGLRAALNLPLRCLAGRQNSMTADIWETNLPE
jgi:ArsR family metal-binding transcriptional regulator